MSGNDPSAPLAWADVIGWYESERSGAPAARMFVDNPEHALVSPAGKLSSIVFEDAVGPAAAVA